MIPDAGVRAEGAALDGGRHVGDDGRHTAGAGRCGSREQSRRSRSRAASPRLVVAWWLWPGPLAACAIPDAIPVGKPTARTWEDGAVAAFGPGPTGPPGWVFLRSNRPSGRVWAFDVGRGRLVGPAAADSREGDAWSLTPAGLVIPHTPAGPAAPVTFGAGKRRAEARSERAGDRPGSTC